MFKRILLIAVSLWMLVASGCSLIDPDDNRRRLNVMKADLDMAVEDLDFILGLDRPSPLHFD